ncbi:MAG TPA: hypothetical protein VFJ53_02290 [Solirubrobacterales bacterium]|nr:hypothetical protein [Solirubrobacterales bacterium]
MKRKLILAVVTTVAAASVAAPAQASTAIYVGAGDGYFAAFKVEDGHPSVLAVDAHIYCLGTGSHSDEDAGQGTAERFPAPVRLRPTAEGLRGFDELRGPYETESAMVRARIRRGRFVGTIVATHGGPGFRCQSGSYRGDPEIPFEAARYVRAGAPNARRRKGDRATGAIYFAHMKRVEVFLRRRGPRYVDVRGAARQRCTIPAGAAHLPRVPLFERITGPRIGNGGRFREHWHDYGPARKHMTYDERITLTGAMGPRATIGSYSRIKVKKRGRRIARRCETDPVRYKAFRYVPAR